MPKTFTKEVQYLIDIEFTSTIRLDEYEHDNTNVILPLSQNDDKNILKDQTTLYTIMKNDSSKKLYTVKIEKNYTQML